MQTQDLKAKLAEAEAEMLKANYAAMIAQNDNSAPEHIAAAIEYAEMCAQKVALLRAAVKAAEIDECLICGDQFPSASVICARCAQYDQNDDFCTVAARAALKAADKCTQCGLTFEEASDQCDRCFTRGADFYDDF